MNQIFKDFFSAQAGVYAMARPHYPLTLFLFLSGLCKERKVVWDCATGNGQAALGLAPYFEKVIATDASEAQIEKAYIHPKVTFSIQAAEFNSIENRSLNLITVAQAAHWFQLEIFYENVVNALKPNGVLAIWCYSEAIVEKNIDALMEWFMYDFLYNYWPNDRWLVRAKYRTIEFQFIQIGTPDFYCVEHWNLQQFLNYSLSWSSTNQYIKLHANNPIQEVLLPKILPLWGEPEKVREVKWQLHLKVAKI